MSLHPEMLDFSKTDVRDLSPHVELVINTTVEGLTLPERKDVDASDINAKLRELGSSALTFDIETLSQKE